MAIYDLLNSLEFVIMGSFKMIKKLDKNETVIGGNDASCYWFW